MHVVYCSHCCYKRNNNEQYTDRNNRYLSGLLCIINYVLHLHKLEIADAGPIDVPDDPCQICKDQLLAWEEVMAGRCPSNCIFPGS